MSRTSRYPRERAALTRPCPFCHAPTDVWCVVATGRTAGTPVEWLHAARLTGIPAPLPLGSR